MKKVILSLAAVAMVVTVSSALEIQSASTNHARARNVEQTAVGSIKMDNVNIKNKTDVANSAVAGNTGVMVKGKDVKMTNVTIKNDSKVKNSAVHGNTGVKIKAKTVDAKNVNITNDTNVKNSAVAGNTGVQLGN